QDRHPQGSRGARRRSAHGAHWAVALLQANWLSPGAGRGGDQDRPRRPARWHCDAQEARFAKKNYLAMLEAAVSKQKGRCEEAAEGRKTGAVIMLGYSTQGCSPYGVRAS